MTLIVHSVTSNVLRFAVFVNILAQHPETFSLLLVCAFLLHISFLSFVQIIISLHDILAMLVSLP